MSLKRDAGARARDRFGWWAANRWLILRRLAQLGFLTVFLTGPFFGVWIAKGTLAQSLTFGVLPLSDPFILLQSVLAGHWPELTALTGAAAVRERGWWRAHRFLLLRRTSQIGILMLFLLGPLVPDLIDLPNRGFGQGMDAGGGQ